MIQEHKELLEQIEDACVAAAALDGAGENVSHIARHLRLAKEDTQKRIDFYREQQQQKPAPAPEPPTDPKSLLMQNSKSELLAIVDDWNTTPGRTALITLETNANKSEIADAILAAQAEREPIEAPTLDDQTSNS